MEVKMLKARLDRRYWISHSVGALIAGILTASCVSLSERPYMDATGNHESPHPHIADAGKSTPESIVEPVRVRDEKERARMERYIAEYVNRDDVVSTIKLSEFESIDCVALDKQPALRRPELKGLQLQLKAPSSPDDEPEDVSSILLGDPVMADRLETSKLEYGSRVEICPEHTVPLR